jgi:transposase
MMQRPPEAIAEAVTRPSMRFVPVKDIAQQDIQALHRVRERLVTARTALVNEMRGLLAEYGIVLPQGVAKFRQALVSTLEAEQTKLTPLGQELFHKLFAELGSLEAELAYYQEKPDSTGFRGNVLSPPCLSHDCNVLPSSSFHLRT